MSLYIMTGNFNELVCARLYGGAVTCPMQPHTRQLLPLFLPPPHLVEKDQTGIFLTDQRSPNMTPTNTVPLQLVKIHSKRQLGCSKNLLNFLNPLQLF